jgi:hypothetical protein
MSNDDDAGGHPADDDVSSLPLTPATAWLFSNLLPPTRVPQQTLIEAGELINPLVHGHSG